MSDGLSNLKKIGFSPKTIIDIGAASGTHCLYSTFPDAHHILIEPLVEHEPTLKSLKLDYSHLDYYITAVGNKIGKTQINVHAKHLDGSSLLNEQLSDYDGKKRSIPITTLDVLFSKYPWKAPGLLKIDTQGNELNILKGATKILDKFEYIIIETSFFEFYKGQPLIGDIIHFMQKYNFVLYDMFDLGLRPFDNACGQIDLAFVKKKGLFRQSSLYATLDQWQPPKSQL